MCGRVVLPASAAVTAAVPRTESLRGRGTSVPLRGAADIVGVVTEDGVVTPPPSPGVGFS
jgi:hypothetical protein